LLQLIIIGGPGAGKAPRRQGLKKNTALRIFPPGKCCGRKLPKAANWENG
jgi:hypothetical protein